MPNKLDKDADKKIAANFNTFRKLCETVGDRAENMLKLVDYFDIRLAIAPASGRTNYHSCYPGGLIDHSLKVLKNAMKIIKSYDMNSRYDKDTLVIVCLMHDIGKLGDLDNDFYLVNDSDWHRERGMLYKINDSIQYMSHSDRSIYLLQHFGVKLSEDEWLAIKIHDGPGVDENRTYRMKENMLSLILHQADRMATQLEKEEYDANS